MKSNNLNLLIIEDELLIAEMLKELLIELEYTVVAIAKTTQQPLSNSKNIPKSILPS